MIRAATLDDAAEIAGVMNGVIAEHGLTLFDRPFSAEDERHFIASLGPRSTLHVAQVNGAIVGVQSLDLFSSMSASMSHVATMGTWIAAPCRGCGVGRALADASLSFASSAAYEKIVVQVLAGNERALRYYRRLEFADIGVARRHVKLGDVVHDEVFLEKFL